MQEFSYEARNNKGEIVTGIVESERKPEAIALVEEQGYTLLSLVLKKKKKEIKLAFLQPITMKDLVAFYRQLSMMISSDISIVQSLKIISEQLENQKLRGVISDVYRNVNEGMKFSDAIGEHEKVFGNFYIHMVRSGEASGKFGSVLEYLADSQEKDYQFRAKIKGAMMYPIFILAAMFIMGVGMMVFVIPRLTVMLLESGVELPLSTRALIAISDWTKSYWYILIFGVFGSVFGGRMFVSRSRIGKRIWHKFLLKIPSFGSTLVKKTYLVRLTKSLALLLNGGVPLIQSLEISSSVVGNIYYQDMLIRTTDAVKDGNTIYSVFEKYPHLVPSMLIQMTNVGEQTGRLDHVFEKVGDFYESEVDIMIDNISKIIEPFIMVIMGVGVGFLVIAIMVPMFKASQAV